MVIRFRAFSIAARACNGRGVVSKNAFMLWIFEKHITRPLGSAVAQKTYCSINFRNSGNINYKTALKTAYVSSPSCVPVYMLQL
jgi:hypothetical protein